MRIDCDVALWSTKHPIVLSGLAVGGWLNVLAIARWIGVLTGVGVVVLSLVLWLPGGPLRRLVERRCGMEK